MKNEIILNKEILMFLEGFFLYEIGQMPHQAPEMSHQIAVQRG